MKKVFVFTMAWMFALSLLAGTAMAQDEEQPKAEPAPSKLALKTQEISGSSNYSIGVGALFTNGQGVDQLQAPFLSAHLHGFEIPNIPEELAVETGAILEIGKDTLQPTLDDVNIRIWSTQRMTVGNVITGTDLKVVDSGDYEFDARVVAGYAFNVHFSAEIYLFENERPISATFFYRF